MNLTQLRYFIDTVEAGSMTQAAQNNFISQSAISKTIKQLEVELDVKLFDRNGKKLALTKQGKVFYSYVADGIKLLDKGVSILKSNSEYLADKPISILFLVSSPLISQIVNQISQRLPNVRLNLSQHIQPTTDLEQFDFIISTHKYKQRTNIPLFTEEILLGGYKLAGNVQLEELQRLDLIALDTSTPLRKYLDDFFYEKAIQLDYRYETDDPATLRSLALQGVGVCFIPKVSWKEFAKQIPTAHILPTPPMRTIYLSQSKGRDDSIFKQLTTELLRIFAVL